MTFQATPYTELLLFAGMLSASLGVYGVLRYRSATRNRAPLLYFSVLMAASAAWSIAHAIELAEVEFAQKVFWLGVSNLPSVVAPTAWLAFALSYTDNDEYLTPRTWALLAIEPIVIAVVVLTATEHSLYYYDLGTTTEPGFVVLTRELGPLFALHAAYSYVLVLAGVLAFLQFVRLDDDTYRGQAILLVGGSLLPVLSNAAFVLDVFGGYVNFTGVVLGISGVAFALAIKRYRFFDLAPIARDSVVELMRDGYLVCDDTGVVVDNNRAIPRLLGVDDDLVGRQLEELLPEIANDLANVASTDRTHEAIERDVDGQRRYLHVTVSSLDAADGTLVVVRDVTDRRRAERRFQSLIERSTDVITVLDADGTVDYVSSSVERVLGLDTETIVGTPVFELLHPDDRDEIRDAFERLVEDDEAVDRVEYRVPNEDGEWRVHEGVTRNLLDDPDVEGVVVNSRDVTARKEREREIEAANEQLAATNERLDRFASVVSHDLRNPLNVADGYREVLAEQYDDPAIGEIEESHERMRRIVDDVLALARGDDVVEERQRLDLATVARTAWGNVETGDATLEATTASIFGDRDRLVRAFENLFRNSIEHGTSGQSSKHREAADSPASTDASSIRVTVGPSANGFFVADDGAGIPEEIRDSLFQEGVSGDEGTGLGLAIVKTIVNAHGWTIDAVDSPTGARFEITPDGSAIAPEKTETHGIGFDPEPSGTE